MTDEGLVEKKLAFLETCVRELEDLIRPEDIVSDLKSERFAEHTLQLAIQAALDVASHIVSDERLGEPRTNRELFRALAENGWVPPELLPKLTGMAGLRNILVHGYTSVDREIVRDVVENHLGDLLEFASRIRARLAS